jgi:chromosome segregation ATPase
MSDTSQKPMTKEEVDRELVRALDDLVTDGRYHVQQITESLARTEELRRQREFAARERPPSYNGGAAADRFDRLDRALESLTHQVADVTREVADVKREVADLKGEVADVKREVLDVKRDVADIRERMATKVELEATNENVKKMADGYATTQQRLDRVADMLKNRALFP